MGLRVKATQVGFYNGSRIRVGQVFEIAGEKQFSKNWMTYVDKDTPTTVKVRVKPLKEDLDKKKPLGLPQGKSGAALV